MLFELLILAFKWHFRSHYPLYGQQIQYNTTYPPPNIDRQVSLSVGPGGAKISWKIHQTGCINVYKS